MSNPDTEKTYQHVSVLLNEAVSLLIDNPEGVYVDCTFGRGGHSAKVLEQLSVN